MMSGMQGAAPMGAMGMPMPGPAKPKKKSAPPAKSKKKGPPVKNVGGPSTKKLPFGKKAGKKK